MAFSAFSQDFPIPYNPDDDSNGLIGTPDLLSLLALFGEEFSAAVVSEDNESAVMYGESRLSNLRSDMQEFTRSMGDCLFRRFRVGMERGKDQ